LVLGKKAQTDSCIRCTSNFCQIKGI